MKTSHAISLLIAGLLFQALGVMGAELPSSSPTFASAYVLMPNDVVQMKVYQEDDMETKVRVGKDGTATFPLIGVVRIGGYTVEQAASVIRQLLDRDYLVNPQVSLSVVEYSKRRFTVLGQVQKPGAYEIPSEESASLLQAIAMAGGYTRLANAGKVTITRIHGGQKMSYTLDARSLASDPNAKAFEVQADDTITVHERFF